MKKIIPKNNPKHSELKYMSTQIEFGDQKLIKAQITRYKITKMNVGYSVSIFFDKDSVQCRFGEGFGQYCSYMQRSDDMSQFAQIERELKNI